MTIADASPTNQRVSTREGSGGQPIHVVIPCAGVGERAGAGVAKQYALLHGEPLVAHTLRAVAAVPGIERIVVVLAPGDAHFNQLVPDTLKRRIEVTHAGGATRAETVLNGLRHLHAAHVGAESAGVGEGAATNAAKLQDDAWVLVHDAARCLIEPSTIARLIQTVGDDAVGGLLALPLADTLKSSVTPASEVTDAVPRVAQTLDRRAKWLAQTPQMFRLGLLIRALQAAGAGVTDESSAIEALGLEPMLVRGDAMNLKVTWPDDFKVAARWLASAA
jgi:2-C-methyl-D-erythritol 4-phosphate cytidylyltransferase